jgi:hypothetical protein
MKTVMAKKSKKAKHDYRVVEESMKQKALEIKRRPKRAFDLAKRLDRKGREK